MNNDVEKMIDVRCPFKYASRKNKKVYPCNRLIVKVNPGSSGEAYCSSCKISFFFEVNEQSFSKTSIKVQK